MSRFVFLDRDGTLVRDEGYTHRVADYELLPGVREGLQRLAAGGFRLAVVTNQSGIGRGYYGEADFQAFQAHLIADLARSGIRIERSFFCPHVPAAGCGCRKPEPGMLWQARDALGADLPHSWVIGNDRVDVELARRAGCRAVQVVADDAAPATGAGELVAPRFDLAAQLVLKESARSDR